MSSYPIYNETTVRLRPILLEQDVIAAVSWYKDPEVLYYSEGCADPYDALRVERMYRFLAAKGEVYIIEVRTDSGWTPIGDAALCKDCLPIVIGKQAYRSIGIGQIVLRLLIERARDAGMGSLRVNAIFDYNKRSLRLYEGAGFQVIGTRTDEDGLRSFQMELALEEVAIRSENG